MSEGQMEVGGVITTIGAILVATAIGAAAGAIAGGAFFGVYLMVVGIIIIGRS